MLRAVTLDYWDTIYVGASLPERVTRRREALLRLVHQLGSTVSAAEFEVMYRDSAIEADRWWREEHRGYHTTDRVRWILDRMGLSASEAQVTDAAITVDQTLIDLPAPLLPGARELLAALGSRVKLAIVSDTGFASGNAQDALLKADGVRAHFGATIYSMDVGRAKPHPTIFQAALDALGVPASDALHVGDNERTDVGGALAMGMRAVRLDAVRTSGPSRAEYVARSLHDLTTYLLAAS